MENNATVEHPEYGKGVVIAFDDHYAVIKWFSQEALEVVYHENSN